MVDCRSAVLITLYTTSGTTAWLASLGKRASQADEISSRLIRSPEEKIGNIVLHVIQLCENNVMRDVSGG